MNVKKIIKEVVNDTDWIEESDPSVVDILTYITKDYDHINVVNDSRDGSLWNIADRKGLHYFDESFSEEMEWDDLMHFIRDDYDRCLEGVELEMTGDFGIPMGRQGLDDDCIDYIELYELMDNYENSMNESEEDDFKWIVDTVPPKPKSEQLYIGAKFRIYDEWADEMYIDRPTEVLIKIIEFEPDPQFDEPWIKFVVIETYGPTPESVGNEDYMDIADAEELIYDNEWVYEEYG